MVDSKHIGLIGGIGPAATEYYYRGLVKAHIQAGAVMQLTMVHADTRTLIGNLEKDARQEQAEIFCRFVERLQAAGAQMAVVTSLAGHFCIKELEAISPLPIVNAIPIIDQHFKQKKLRRVALLGTRAVMASSLYGGVTSVEFVLPSEKEIAETSSHYLAMANAGAANEVQRNFLQSIGERLCLQQGADAVALAGTDLYLVFDGVDPGYPVIDLAQVHVEAIATLALTPA